jgi:SnoaL-like protein
MANSIDAEATLKKFVARINAHDPSGIIALCTADHVFIDSLGSKLSGHKQLEQGWSGYFSLFPDYHRGRGRGFTEHGCTRLWLRIRYPRSIEEVVADSSCMACHRERWANCRVAGLR